MSTKVQMSHLKRLGNITALMFHKLHNGKIIKNVTGLPAFIKFKSKLTTQKIHILMLSNLKKVIFG